MKQLEGILMSQLLEEFHGIGRTLVMFNCWDKYSDLWFAGLMAGIQDADRRVVQLLTLAPESIFTGPTLVECNPGVVCTHEGPCNKTCGGDHYYDDKGGCLRCGRRKTNNE